MIKNGHGFRGHRLGMTAAAATATAAAVQYGSPKQFFSSTKLRLVFSKELPGKNLSFGNGAQIVERDNTKHAPSSRGSC